MVALDVSKSIKAIECFPLERLLGSFCDNVERLISNVIVKDSKHVQKNFAICLFF